MIFNKTTEYAIRVMFFLTLNKDTRFSVNRLHKQLGIPYKYLGRLMSKLAIAGLVEVSHGKQGGFSLTSSKPTIYLHEIIGLVEDLGNYDRCILGFSECAGENPCHMHQIWAKQKDEIRKIIFQTTLDDISHVSNIKH